MKNGSTTEKMTWRTLIIFAEMRWNRVKKASENEDEYLENSEKWLANMEKVYKKNEVRFGKENLAFKCMMKRAKNEINCHQNSVNEYFLETCKA